MVGVPLLAAIRQWPIGVPVPPPVQAVLSYTQVVLDTEKFYGISLLTIYAWLLYVEFAKCSS